MKLVAATNNENKIKEIQALISEGVELLKLENIGCTEDIPETSPTIQGNAIQKAQYIYDKYGYNCFADDTGLEIECLEGEPGVYSARYAGVQKSAQDNMDKVLKKMKGEMNRKARFTTVIALIIDGKLNCFEGVVNGNITLEKSGQDGFGYDPIFKPDGESRTFSEMPLSEKNEISHRGRAVKKLVAYLASIE